MQWSILKLYLIRTSSNFCFMLYYMSGYSFKGVILLLRYLKLASIPALHAQIRMYQMISLAMTVLNV